MSLFTLNLPAFFAVNTHLAVSWQELRKAVREVNSPPPQLEDPDWALDPRLEEDPDIFVELVDRTFYQLSCDGALVAIIADYPGLLPASHVSKTEVPTSKKDSLFAPYPPHMYCVLQGRPSGRRAKPAVTRQQGAPKPDRLKRKAVRTETLSQRYEREPRFMVVVF